MVETLLRRLDDASLSWPMAYALSWVSVAGGDSVMPPWVRAQFRDAARIVRDLRDTNCRDAKCSYCQANNDPKLALDRWFGFQSFRSEPIDEFGRPLQERIIQSAMEGESLLGILPTRTGKSICYQIPALSRFDKTGVLTVIVFPLCRRIYVEWFAEWARDACGERRGLKLLTAHRAKGLESDDVVMTRAKRNLIVMSNDNHEYLPSQSLAVINRHVTPDLASFPGPRRYFQSVEMRMVDLSFAGRQGHRHVIH